MLSFRLLTTNVRFVCFAGFAATFVMAVGLPARAQASSPAAAPASASPSPAPNSAPAPQPVASNYNPAIFQNPVPGSQLAFLSRFAGSPSGQVIRDKQFRKLLKTFVPDCMFHYGQDRMLSDAMDMVLKGSEVPAQLQDGRYLIVSGKRGPYLRGRGFLWIDMQTGIGLGGFYFHPTNGEPTPSLVVFSRQVKEEPIERSQLPPAFAAALNQWSSDFSVSPVTTTYFITGSNKRILLEHDEEYCFPSEGSAPNPNCQQMDADAGDLDMNAALYLQATHYATNATAWMLNDPAQITWVQLRDSTCGAGPNALRCHIRMTRERTHVIIHRIPSPPPRGPRRR